MKKLGILLLIAVVSLVSCLTDEDEPKDKIEQVTVYVSAETGFYKSWERDDLIEGMLIKEEDATQWFCEHFMFIAGFTYEKGNEYELLVEKTTLANPPQDVSNFKYRLIRIISQTKKE